MFDWLHSAGPDIFCIQETKANPDQLAKRFTEPVGYHVWFSSAEKKGYSGVALYSKEKPKSVELLGQKEFDSEGRTLIADYNDFILINSYFPNSQDGGKRLDYKLAFCQSMMELTQRLRDEGRNIVLTGDYNIAHKPIDLARPKQNEGNPGYLPEERTWMDSFTEAGFVDTFRLFTKEGGHYTWWSYRTRGRERNVGWRIDYFCVNPEFQSSVSSSTIQSDVYGSDHCPLSLEINV